MTEEIKAIVFDLGNVLIDLRYDFCINNLKEYSPDIQQKYLDFFTEKKYLMMALESGKLGDMEFVEEIKKYLGIEIETELLARHISEIFTEKKRITSLLPVLKENYKLYMLSNTSSLHKNYGWGGYEFLKHFDRLFLSNEIGYLKPVPEIYSFVESNISFHPKELLYTDDVAEYISAASDRGWNTIHFKDEDYFLSELKNRNIKFE